MELINLWVWKFGKILFYIDIYPCVKETVLKESLARTYFQQMVEAIYYLHARNICHRDLKPENIVLCSSNEKNPVLKLTDLGLSKLVDQTILKTFCGTRFYMAPEMWKKAGKGLVEVYSLKVDCWALVIYKSTARTKLNHLPFSQHKKMVT